MIRSFKIDDTSQLLALIEMNIPEYFAASELEDYKEFLNNQIEDYFVYEENSVIIGAGGINYFPANRKARISWDIVNPNNHGKGIGSLLLEHRINILKANQNFDSVEARTSQHANKFYLKAGFELERIEKDFWEKGFDLYQMKLAI